MSEGIFLVQKGMSPYCGGVYHQPPLLLAVLYPIVTFLSTLPSWLYDLSIDVIFTLADISIAFVLLTWCKYELKLQHTKVDVVQNSIPRCLLKQNAPATVATVYLCHPYTIFCCVGRSTLVFTQFLSLLAFLNARRGNVDIFS